MEKLQGNEKFQEMAKKIVKGLQRGELPADEVFDYGGYQASVSEAGEGKYLVALGDLDIEVTGNERLRAKVLVDEEPKAEKPKKQRKKKENLPARIERTCEITGRTFETSKFTPNVKVSPEGRKIKKTADKHGISYDRIMELQEKLVDADKKIMVYNKTTDEVVLLTNDPSEASPKIVADLDNLVWVHRHI